MVFLKPPPLSSWRRFGVVLLLVLTTTSLLCAADEDPRATRAKKAAAEVCEAVKNGDTAKLIDAMPTAMIEAGGGKIRMTKFMDDSVKAAARDILSIRMENPGEFLTEGGNTFVVVPFSMDIRIPLGKAIVKSYLLGISSDGGESWKLSDVTGFKKMPPEMRDRFFPKFPADLKLPEKQVPQYVFGRTSTDGDGCESAPNADAIKNETAKSDFQFQGSWVIDSHVFSGVPLATQGSVEFKADRAVFNFAGQKLYNAVIQIDRSKVPGEIDLAYLDGPARGKARKGIFLFADGKLSLCFHESRRPTKLESAAGSDVIMYVLTPK